MKQKLMAVLTGLVWLGLLCAVIATKPQSKEEPKNKDTVKKEIKPIKIPEKSQAAKQKVMDEDLAIMDYYGLYYDYPNLSLEETVKAYLDEFGIPYDSVAFSYKNMETGQMFSMNDEQPMTAGSTYKLPLNMLVVDGVRSGRFSMTKEYDISKVQYENEYEFLAYLGQFGESMTIPEMQRYSLVYSENTPAHGLVQMLGGFSKAYKAMERYGKSKSDLKTIDINNGNKTTTDFYIQVLDYLWHHQKEYEDILAFIGESFPNQYYKAYWPNLTIYQKPGYVAEALNIDAIVYEETPYLIALYTAGLGGASAADTEVNPYGYHLLTQLTYVINEWHRVNQNP
ncbi:serine hydrolase [Streptococcus fryi]